VIGDKKDMARDDIRLDQINARLGGMNKPRVVNGYEELPPKQVDFDEDQATNSSSGNGIFMFSIAGIFAAVFGGTFFFSGGLPSGGLNFASLMGSNATNYNSSVSSCVKGWMPRAQNDTQLMCLLNNNIARLCNPQERDYMVAMYNRYTTDRGRYEDDQTARGLRAAVVLQGTQGELRDALKSQFKELESVIKNDGVVPSRGVEDHVGGYFKKLNDVAGLNEEERAAEKVPRVPEMTKVLALRRLAAAGYMTKFDFGWFPDEMLSQAFEGYEKAESPCKS
jgi:hypothetical protein